MSTDTGSGKPIGEEAGNGSMFGYITTLIWKN
jgi:hypothetical protein